MLRTVHNAVLLQHIGYYFQFVYTVVHLRAALASHQIRSASTVQLVSSIAAGRCDVGIADLIGSELLWHSKTESHIC